MQGLLLPGQSAPAAAAPVATVAEQVSKTPDPIAVAEAAIKASEAAERAAAQAQAAAAQKARAAATNVSISRVPPKTVRQPIVPAAPLCVEESPPNRSRVAARAAAATASSRDASGILVSTEPLRP
jgi:hypothetical protein